MELEVLILCPSFHRCYVLLNFTQHLKPTLVLFCQLFSIGWIQSAVLCYDCSKHVNMSACDAMQ